GGDGREGLGPVAQTEQMQEVRSGRITDLDGGHRAFDSLPDALGVGRLADAADLSDDVEHGQVRDPACVGLAGALEAGDRLARQALAELADQPRLPDPGLTGDADGVPAPIECRREIPLEQREMMT